MNVWLVIHICSVVGALSLEVIAVLARVSGSGRYITIPMVKTWAIWQLKKKIRKGEFLPGNRYETYLSAWFFRFCQLSVLWFLGLWIYLLHAFSGLPCPNWLYDVVCWWPWSLLFIDDLLNLIDRDKWKKRWQNAKNKLKWKMRLPVRVPQPTA